MACSVDAPEADVDCHAQRAGREPAGDVLLVLGVRTRPPVDYVEGRGECSCGDRAEARVTLG